MKIKNCMLFALTAVLANAYPGWASAAAPAMHVSVAAEEFNGPFPSWGNVQKPATWGGVASTLPGATGDGKTDDTAALQRALDSMAKRLINGTSNTYLGGSPAVMYLPKGTYRITGTLYMSNKSGVELVGEDPANTIIKWDGPPGGTMMILDGVFQSRFGRITWDGTGNGSGPAGIGIAHWYNTAKQTNGDGLLYGGSVQHVDEVFTDMGTGIVAGCCNFRTPSATYPPAGSYGQLDSEGSIRRTKFIRNSVAGLSVESYNALDWWVWDSEFTDCRAGLTNMIGAGNFMAYRNTFTRSTKADVHVGNTSWFSMHNNVSTGSNRFFEAAVTGLNSAQVIMQNNRIFDTTQATAILNGNLGPVLMLDNHIRSLGDAGPVFEANGSTKQSDLISIGNLFTVEPKFRMHTGGEDRQLSLEDQVVRPSAIPAASLPAVVAAKNQNRVVFEVPVVRDPLTLIDTASTEVIQGRIDAAADSGEVNPIVHLPTGTYYLTKPLVLPARKRIQLMGDGINTRLMTNIPTLKALLVLQGPSYATVRDIYMRTMVSTAVIVENADQVGGRIFLNGVTSAALNITGIANTRVEGQANTNFATINATAAGSVLMMGTGGIGPVTINSGSNVVLNDTWFEGRQTKLFRGDSGNFTYLGGTMAPADPVHGGGNLDPAVYLDGFAGQFTMAGVRMNLKSTSNGIMINTDVPETKFLGLGIYASYPIAEDFFQRKSPGGGDVRFSHMKAKVQTITIDPLTKEKVATYAVRQLGDDGTANPDSILAGLAQTRGLVWDAVPYVAPAGVTDVHFYRVRNIDAAVGFDIINGVK